MAQFATEKTTFLSSDGIHEIVCTLYIPEMPPRGVIEFAHGMAEHRGRYAEMGNFFAVNGFIFAICDHLGHGESVLADTELGYFAPEDGADTVVSDLYKFARILKERFSDLPFILMGHSMGSFLVRLFAMHYGNILDALVVLGTGGPVGAVKFGKILTNLIASVKGQKYRSKLIRNLAFAGYLSRCGKNANPASWITTKLSRIESYENDPKCNFTFTVRGYYDLFDMTDRVNRRGAAELIPKQLPVWLASGLDDPVGAYGKGPTAVCEALKAAGVRDVTLKLYPGARHELHNEFCSDEFYSDLLDYLNGKFTPQTIPVNNPNER